MFALHFPELRAAELTASDWREDLRALAEGLPKKHANAFHEVSRERWLAAVADLDARIPSLSREEIEVGIMKLVAMIGDGHTAMSPFYLPQLGFHTVPLRFYAFSDGIFVRAAASQYRDLVGARLRRVGGLAVDEAFDRVASTVSHDNDQGLRLVVPLYFGVAEVLDGLGIIKGSQSISFELEKNGRRFSQTVPATILLAHGPHGGGSLWADPPGWVDAREGGEAEAPLWLKSPQDLYWMEYLEPSKTLYVQYNAVDNKPDLSIAEFFERAFRLAKEKEAERFVLDIRNNVGGNGYFNAPIIRGLLRSGFDARGRLFVIVGRSTFSAAQLLINDLDLYAEPTYVGEPGASRPTSYGDHDPLTLPKSRLVVMASTVLHYGRGKGDLRKWTSIDLPAELSFEQYRRNADPPMEAIVGYRSISLALAPALASGDPTRVRRAYESFQSDEAAARIPTEREINGLGYRFLGEGKLDLAILLFELNVESYLKSANAYDSLGEACVAAKRFDRAIESYRKVLELSPGNERAAKALKELESRARP